MEGEGGAPANSFLHLKLVSLLEMLDDQRVVTAQLGVATADWARRWLILERAARRVGPHFRVLELLSAAISSVWAREAEATGHRLESQSTDVERRLTALGAAVAAL